MTSLNLRKIIRPLGFLIVAILAVLVMMHIWNYYNAEPWTRDGRIRGDVITLLQQQPNLPLLLQDQI